MATAPAENKNLAIWDALSKTDPNHTKGFNRAGGFKGTAIKPIWIIRKLTEQFGPCGTGWGINEPKFEVLRENGEVLVYCIVSGWHGKPQNVVWGIGGDKAVAKRSSGAFSDDEAFKKAFTDAVGNAFKFVGVGADVHMGLFEDSKYLAQVREEYAPQHDEPQENVTPLKRQLQESVAREDGKPKREIVRLAGPIETKTALMAAVRAFMHEVGRAPDIDSMDALIDSEDALIKQVKRDFPGWWDGSETKEPGMAEQIATRRQVLIDEMEQANDAWRKSPVSAG